MESSSLLFRSSANGYLMTEPQGKSNLEKWLEACANLDKYRADYDAMKNKETKTAKNKAAQIEKTARLVDELYIIKDKKELAETVKTHLVDIFASEHYGRKEEINSKFLTKGNVREEDSITLLSRVHKKFYKKNSQKLSNEFIKGEPDLFEGEEILKATHTLDTKTSWSLHTFLRAKHKTLDSMYYWQGQSYMGLTGATQHTVVYCLVNGTDTAINDEKRKLSFVKGMVDHFGNNTPEYIEKCKQIEINHIFDLEAFTTENPHFQFDNDVTVWSHDIPMEERIHSFTFDRNDNDIERLYKRIGECRTWMEENLYNNVKQLA